MGSYNRLEKGEKHMQTAILVLAIIRLVLTALKFFM